MNPKKIAGESAVSYIKNNMTIGLGTGSTAYWAIKKIGERVREEGLNLICTATSLESELLAIENDIQVRHIKDIERIDITIDGADEADHLLNLIKGGGGALLREKIIAYITDFYIIVADESKYVKSLGKFKLPVEVVPFGWEKTSGHLKNLGAKPALRIVEQEIFITDNGNYIIDCDFGLIEDPYALETKIQNIPGVITCGLFLNMANKLVLGKKDGSVEEINK